MKKATFIINPKSGFGNGLQLGKAISSNKNLAFLKSEIFYTESKGHATEIAKNALQEESGFIVACGGDGTVNEIAKSLVGSGKTMAILPTGSGNGLARHYGIKNDLEQFKSIIQSGKTVQHDAVRINEHTGFNVSGIGFDAHVAMLFGKDGRRGFNSYLRLIAKEFSRYKTFKTEITFDNKSTIHQTLMIPIAVASQFGNNAFIAPQADTSDGMTDLTLVCKMNMAQVLPFAFRVFTKRIGGSDYAKSYCSKEFLIKCDCPQPLHVDGEPGGLHESFKIETIPAAIRLAIP